MSEAGHLNHRSCNCSNWRVAIWIGDTFSLRCSPDIECPTSGRWSLRCPLILHSACWLSYSAAVSISPEVDEGCVFAPRTVFGTNYTFLIPNSGLSRNCCKGKFYLFWEFLLNFCSNMMCFSSRESIPAHSTTGSLFISCLNL